MQTCVAGNGQAISSEICREGCVRVTAPDYGVIKAADEFTDKTTAINEMWQIPFSWL